MGILQGIKYKNDFCLCTLKAGNLKCEKVTEIIVFKDNNINNILLSLPLILLIVLSSSPSFSSPPLLLSKSL